MFPVVKISVRGLKQSGMYSMWMDFLPVDEHRWKYVNGDWATGGKAEPHMRQEPYVHPDSPNFGAHWMKEDVCFEKIKLTNKEQGKGKVSRGDKGSRVRD